MLWIAPFKPNVRLTGANPILTPLALNLTHCMWGGLRPDTFYSWLHTPQEAFWDSKSKPGINPYRAGTELTGFN